MNPVLVAEEDPRGTDVVELLEAHLATMRSISPPGHVHALDLDGLAAPDVTFLTARSNGRLLGVGALRDLGHGRAEIKSMHTAAAARGHGIGRRLLDRILELAVERRLSWLGLETGSQPEFAPARTMYASVGFETCLPFGDYTVNPFSTCMSLDLQDRSVGS